MIFKTQVVRHTRSNNSTNRNTRTKGRADSNPPSQSPVDIDWVGFHNFNHKKRKEELWLLLSFLVLLTAQQLKKDKSALSVEVNAMLWLWLWTPKFQRQTPPNAFFSTVVTVGCKSLTLYLSIYLSIIVKHEID